MKETLCCILIFTSAILGFHPPCPSCMAFNTSTFCQDRARLRFDQAEDIRQAVRLAVEMLKIDGEN